jgi:hypothetical protein
MNLFCGLISLIQVLLFPLLGIGGLSWRKALRDDDKFIFELSINGHSFGFGQACIWRVLKQVISAGLWRAGGIG